MDTPVSYAGGTFLGTSSEKYKARGRWVGGGLDYTLLTLHASRAVYTRDDDGLPQRFTESLPRGASAGHPVDPQRMHETIEAFYRERGYDLHGPTDATLRQLGLDEYVGIIER